MIQSGHGMRDGRTDGRTDRRTDRRTDGRTEWNQYTPPTTLLCGGYNKCVSSRTRSPLLHIGINSGLNRKPSRFASNLLLSHWIHIQIPLSHLHPCTISTSCRSIVLDLTPIHVASQLHTDTVSNPARFQNLHLIDILFLSHLNQGQKKIISPPSMYHLTFIQVHRFSLHIHPGCVWIPSRPPRLTSHIHPGCVSPQSRSRYLHLTSIEVTSYLHPDPQNCISPPPRSHLKPIPVLILHVTPSI